MGRILNGTNVLYLNAQEKVYISDLLIDGTYATTNGKRNNAKILVDCQDFYVKDTVISDECTAYNIFEQKQTVQFPVKHVKVQNITAKNNITHNVLNFYNISDDATIEITDCDFDLNIKTSNAARFSNYKNASNVTVIFKNVNWTYDNAPVETADFEWSGLVLLQPASTDAALTGDLSYMLTWKFVFDNCTYNGVKVTGINHGALNQVMYAYNFNKSGKSEDPTSLGLNVEFK